MSATTLARRPAPAGPPASAAALAERRPPTARLVGLEIRKSLSTRSGRLMATAAVVLPAAGVGASIVLNHPPASVTDMLTVLGTLVAMLTLAVGVLATAGEWTHRTVQTTFLTVPRRHRVLIAKYAGMTLFGAAISTLVAASTAAVAAVAAGSGFSWDGAGAAVATTIGVGAAMTVIGAGIGAAVANAPAALTGTYLTLLVGMNLLRVAEPAWASHLDPLQAMAELISRQGSALSHAATLAGWLVAATVAGAVVTRRRALA